MGGQSKTLHKTATHEEKARLVEEEVFGKLVGVLVLSSSLSLLLLLFVVGGWCLLFLPFLMNKLTDRG